MPTGTLEAIAVRPPGANAPQRVGVATVLEDIGLADDIHADRLSPRQLLLASAHIYEKFALPSHALRENLLVDLDTSALTSGTVLQVGPQVTLRLMFQCEACGQLDRMQAGLAGRIGQHRGMLARVLTGGMIRTGDAILDLGVQTRPWSDDWRERVAQVLDAAPDGKVLAYRDLARLAGIQSSYCRAFPRVLARLGPRYAGKAVAAGAALTLPRWDGAGLFD
jgi:MOSC domain-containing protein YiiM